MSTTALPTELDSAPERVLSWILAVALAVRLIPLAFRASHEVSGQSATVMAWTALLWCGLATALALAVRGVVTRGSPRPAAQVFVAVTVLAVATTPWTIHDVFGPEQRPWQLALPITAAATAVLVSDSWRWCVAALMAIVGPTVVSELGTGWQAPTAVVVGDPLFAVALFLAWFATIRAFAEVHRSVRAAHSAAATEFMRAREAETHARSIAIWDAFLHDEVLATLSLINAGAEPAAVKHEARLLMDRLQSAQQSPAPAPTLTAALLEATMSRYPAAETTWRVSPDACVVPPEALLALADATAEALRNVARHAYPNGEAFRDAAEGPAEVELVHDESGVRVTISDQGRGFEPSKTPESSLGVALAIHGRMHAVGGQAEVASVPGRGTQVTLRWSAP